MSSECHHAKMALLTSHLLQAIPGFSQGLRSLERTGECPHWSKDDQCLEMPSYWETLEMPSYWETLEMLSYWETLEMPSYWEILEMPSYWEIPLLQIP